MDFYILWLDGGWYEEEYENFSVYVGKENAVSAYNETLKQYNNEEWEDLDFIKLYEAEVKPSGLIDIKDYYNPLMSFRPQQ